MLFGAYGGVIKQWPTMCTGVHHVGIVKRVTVDCKVEKTFVPSGRFKCVRGKEYWKDGEVQFPEPPECDRKNKRGTYRTHYGWGFAHNGVIYNVNDSNMRYAMRRITGARDPPPEHFGWFNGEAEVDWSRYSDQEKRNIILRYDRLLRDHQTKLITNDYSTLKSCFENSFGKHMFKESKVYAAIMECLKKHTKQKLRIRAITELLRDWKLGAECWLDSVLLKMKPDEIAKMGKYPRMIVDLGVAASLEGAAWAADAKHHIEDKAFRYKDGVCYFCGSPDPIKVMNYFNMMYNHTEKVVMVIFSDDAIVSIKLPDGTYFVFNMDIASCDTSHTHALFVMLFDLFGVPADIRVALEKQILATMRVPSEDGKRTCYLKPLEFYLQSGITITTLINSISQFLMLLKIVDLYPKTPVEVVRAVALAGYKVTVDVCSKFEDLQFLKMSPTKSVNGVYVATLNLGVIFRASGTCRGDLPGFGCLIERARRFQWQLMSGLMSQISHPWLEQLSPIPLDRSEENLKVAQRESNALYATTLGAVNYFSDDIYTRYDLSSNEIAEINFACGKLDFGMLAYCGGVGKILKKDYSLDLPGC